VGEAFQRFLSPLVDAGYGWVLLVAGAIIFLGLGCALVMALRDGRGR